MIKKYHDCTDILGLGSFKETIFVTLDVDWAPEHVLRETIAFFSKKKIPVTLFATHDSSELRKISRHNFHEIGLHPVVMNKSKYGSFSQTKSDIRKLKSIYPMAMGVRFHSLWQSSTLSLLLKDNGITYESNILFPVEYKCFPFIDWSGMIKIPFIWEDDAAIYLNNLRSGFQVTKNNGLKVINIHPIHFYLNTFSLVEYKKISSYGDIRAKYINKTKYGVRDFTEEFFNRNKNSSFSVLKALLAIFSNKKS